MTKYFCDRCGKETRRVNRIGVTLEFSPVTYAEGCTAFHATQKRMLPMLEMCDECAGSAEHQIVATISELGRANAAR